MRDQLRRGPTDRQEVIDAADARCKLSHEVLMSEFHEQLSFGRFPSQVSPRYVAARLTPTAEAQKQVGDGFGRAIDADEEDGLELQALIRAGGFPRKPEPGSSQPEKGGGSRRCECHHKAEKGRPPGYTTGAGLTVRR